MKNKIDKKTIQAIANDAVREAQRKSLKNGVANVYSKNMSISPRRKNPLRVLYRLFYLSDHGRIFQS
jgi:hypothetical protein